VVTLVSKPLLNLPWGYAATLGFLFAAISPAVVIPPILHFQVLPHNPFPARSVLDPKL